jgi:hypothetical protein
LPNPSLAIVEDDGASAIKRNVVPKNMSLAMVIPQRANVGENEAVNLMFREDRR